jgi:hypothetical protein
VKIVDPGVCKSLVAPEEPALILMFLLMEPLLSM